MARIAGRAGRLYVDLSGTGSAEPVAFLNKMGFKQTTGRKDVTSFGDANIVYVQLLPDFQGDFTGYYDTATVQTYTAALDGVARKFYLYPTINTNGQYWYGTALFDFQFASDASGSVDIQGTFAAAGPITKIG